MAEDPRVLSDDVRDRLAEAYGMTREAVDTLIEQMGANRDLVRQQHEEETYDPDSDSPEEGGEGADGP
ncbi:hypothetical protein D3C83_321890 [compost metagenome]